MNIKQLVGLAIMATSTLVLADAAADVDARQKAFKGFKKEMGIMSKAVKASDFDAAEFLAAATRLDSASNTPWAHFTAGSNGGDTEAKPAVWSQPAEFKKAADNFKAEAAKLKMVAATNNLDQIRAQLGATGATCKACHDSFKQ
jgi:cytochrome c556